MTGRRKQVRHFHEPGDLHELTFSCYRRMPLLTNDHWRSLLCESIDRAVTNQEFRLAAFVLMPEHAHLLVFPTTNPVRMDRLLSAIKQPYSVRIRRILEENHSPLLERLMVRERPGKWSFRYWQEGPGYDRNFNTEAATLAAIDSIHLNPVPGPSGAGRTNRRLAVVVRTLVPFRPTGHRPGPSGAARLAAGVLDDVLRRGTSHKAEGPKLKAHWRPKATARWV